MQITVVLWQETRAHEMLFWLHFDKILCIFIQRRI